jgi:hypothetical protein
VPARIWILWALFLIRGSFYCDMLPLWEGWDEYAHFAWLQHWNKHGTLPVAADHISREIDESMRLAPLPLELRWIGAPYLTHEEWWALPQEQRDDRVRRLRSLSPTLASQPANGQGTQAFSFYEAQQPPLYYWIAATVMRSMSSRSIADRVFRMRLFGVFLTSLAIPFTFLAARGAFGKQPGMGDATLCAALLAIAPGFAINSARVANDGLAIALAAIFVWMIMREKTHWAFIGLVLGASILAKAYLLILIPVLAIARLGKPWRPTLYALSSGIAIGGWWYARNLAMGLPLTGWILSAPLAALTLSATHLSWIVAAQSIAKSFTWVGAWSFLTLRSWMYTILEGVALAGMLASITRRNANLRAPYAFTILCALAMVWGAAAYNATQGIPGIPGWYLWPAGGAMAILIVAGLGRFAIGFALMLAAADLFGAAARMMPYYAGLAAWNHGSVMQLPAAMARLNTPAWLAAAWILATLAIPFAMVQGRAKTRM